jgi:pimeloyl-ACP methyl ester carboxylesterase
MQFAVFAVAAAVFLLAQSQAWSQAAESAPISEPRKTGYASVNGLEMYYEVYGKGGTPLVLLHGAFSATGTSFGPLLPGLSKDREVISFEMQGHGHTADIDRPLSLDHMAEDVAAALDQFGIRQADVLGYSMGGGVALRLAIANPEIVRKLVLISAGYRQDGVYPGFWEAMEGLQLEMMAGSPWHDEYLRIAPDPDHFPAFLAKKKQMDRDTRDPPAEIIGAIKSPALVILGDSDMWQPEHAVEMFCLFGGGVGHGDLTGLSRSQLAILPGTSHTSMALSRADLLLPIILPPGCTHA